MGNEEVLKNDILRARIANLEYEKDGPITIEQIRKIYIEECGKEPPGKIEVYRSDDIKEINQDKRNGKDSGFDGTVLHFYDPAKGINQTYTITRGSENAEDGGNGGPNDWLYNLFGIFEGKAQNQLKDASMFDQIVTSEINDSVKRDMERRRKNGEEIQDIPLQKSGIGHSLGGNLIQMLQLKDGGFRNVYAINDCPPSAYQLVLADKGFQFALQHEFNRNVKDDKQLYSIPPSELKAFTEEYYRDKGKNIHHLTANEDMLHAASIIRGFIDLGDRKYVDTNPDFDGILNVVQHLSDKDLQALQTFLGQFGPAYEQGGTEALIRAMTGYDSSFAECVNDVKREIGNFLRNGPDWEGKYLDVHAPYTGFVKFPLIAVPAMPAELTRAIGNLTARIIEMGSKVTNLAKQLPLFGHILLTAMLPLKDKLAPHFEKLKEHAKNLLEIAADTGKRLAVDMFNPNHSVDDDLAGVIFINGAKAVWNIKKMGEACGDMFKEAKTFFSGFGEAADAHSISQLTSVLASGEGKRYEGNDMFLSAGSGSRKIEINLSSAVRIYQLGTDSLHEQEGHLKELKNMYKKEYLEDYDIRKKKLLQKFSDMETHPQRYRYLLHMENAEITNITVNEVMKPLDASFTNAFEDAFHYYETEQAKSRDLINKIRSSIEQLFNKDEKVSSMFDLR
ncbi:DUF6792 domain-containing protein [Bacillus sp. MUM 13]|uniref:DUF6792 domain-containing protein n=1 Tax=Bacillus sp. MUM 13 TaxID=1678001 RepID=UPI0008F5D081|nr:DUF6792 domain-containing protein [Bacillus sp. MUM 13]OIK13314.1 hypothetical protein BIV59_06030 [Bacillus sp. MUM 13]